MGNNNSQVGPSPVQVPQTALQQHHHRQQPAAAMPPQNDNSSQDSPAAATTEAAMDVAVRKTPLVRRVSSGRGYHPRSASLRRMRSIQRRRLLEGTRPPSHRTAKMEADNKKRQDEKHLLAACARGDLKKVERLVDCGVDVNAADKSQMTALHYASMHARDEVIKSLISRGAEVTTTDLKGGFTALHWVVINAEPQYGATDHIDKALSALVKAGCRVNATDFNYATPLHIAAQKGNKGCVQALMRLGADIAKVDITGRNSIEVAKDDQTKALIKRLHEKYNSKRESTPPVYQILEPAAQTVLHFPPPTGPAPPPPVPPPRLVATRKSPSVEDHFYENPGTQSNRSTPSPPVSPSSLRPSSVTPPPPPPRRRRQFCNDARIYHVLEVPPAPKSRPRHPSPPRRRKARKQ